jgi:hypothetical protein
VLVFACLLLLPTDDDDKSRKLPHYRGYIEKIFDQAKDELAVEY